MVLSFEKIVDAFDNAGYEPIPYSGRGMYGKRCLGIVCSNPLDMVLDVIQNYTADDSMNTTRFLVEDLINSSQDDMGRGSIVYWTHIEWKEYGENEDER